MTWLPISGLPTQFSKNAGGASASGYWLKFYKDGTTTVTSMATDSTGSVTLVKAKLNTRGEPLSSQYDDDSVFIPFLSENYKAALYLNEDDADNDDTNSALWVVDSIGLNSYLESIEDSVENILQSVSYTFNTVSDMVSGDTVGGGEVVHASGHSYKTLGFNSVGDEGGAEYVVGSLTPNSYNLIDLGGGLTAELNDKPTLANVGGTSAAFDHLLDLVSIVELPQREMDYTLDLDVNSDQYSISLIGKGADTDNGTFINVVGGNGIEAFSTADYQHKPSNIKNLSVNVTGVGNYAYKSRYQHYVATENFFYYSADDHAIRSKDSWLNVYRNGYVQGNVHGMYLEGANHSSLFERVRFRGEGGSNACVFVDDQGSVADGNSALHFNTCDFEFCTAKGFHYNSPSNCLMTSCYMEQLGSNLFEIDQGNLSVKGGIFIYDAPAAVSNALIVLNGGTAKFEDCQISNHSGAGIAGITNSDVGKVGFFNCQIALPFGGTPLLDGFPLMKGNKHSLLVPSNPVFGIGIHTSGGGSNPTQAIQADGRTTRWTVNAVGYTEIDFTIDPNQMDTGSNFSVMLKYKSNAAWKIRLQTGSLGVGAKTNLPVPTTAGVLKTMLIYDQYKPTTTDVYVTVYGTALNPADYIEIESIYIVPATEMDFMKNLYEPG